MVESSYLYTNEYQSFPLPHDRTHNNIHHLPSFYPSMPIPSKIPPLKVSWCGRSYGPDITSAYPTPSCRFRGWEVRACLPGQ